ncbi:MAG: GNAT family N-acetyltransferase [Polyangiales bacterium]
MTAHDDIEAIFEAGLPTIEGPSLRLRALRPDDAPAVFELYGDRDANRYGYQPTMSEVADAERLIGEIAELARKRTLFHWGVARRDDDVIIGHATLFKLERAHHRAEIGYSIRRDHWGRGLGAEAARQLIAFAFDRLDLRRLEADVDPRNAASLRMLEKLGFEREGYLRERWELAGELQDAVA